MTKQQAQWTAAHQRHALAWLLRDLAATLDRGDATPADVLHHAPMARPMTLPLDRPIAALAEAAGLTVYGLAKAREMSVTTAQQAVKRGGGIGLDTLAAWARAAGYELEVRLKKIDAGA